MLVLRWQGQYKSGTGQAMPCLQSHQFEWTRSNHPDLHWVSLVVMQVLTGSHMAKVLLMVHQQLALARHPVHLFRSLGPLKAALQLLGDHARLPLTFRYVAHILLWLLKTRYLQTSHCLCQIVFQTLSQRVLAAVISCTISLTLCAS